MQRNTILIVLLVLLIVLVAGVGFVFFSTPHVVSPPAKEFFSIVVLPDTQIYAQDYPEIFNAQTQWIVDNTEKLNIVFTVQVGDVVNVAKDKNQWVHAQTALKILTDHTVPYGITLGNHDYTNYAKRESLFSKYFTSADFGAPYERTYYDANTLVASITTLPALTRNVTFVLLPFCPDKNMLAWANRELAQNTNEKFFFTHGYLGADANRFVHVCGSTQYIWDTFVKKQYGMGLVGGGHVHTEALRFSQNDFNQQVLEYLSDYQEYDKGASGYLKILTFYPAQQTLVMQTYSPTKHEYLDSKIDGNFIFTFVE